MDLHQRRQELLNQLQQAMGMRAAAQEEAARQEKIGDLMRGAIQLVDELLAEPSACPAKPGVHEPEKTSK